MALRLAAFRSKLLAFSGSVCVVLVPIYGFLQLFFWSFPIPRREQYPPTFTHYPPQFLRATFGLCLLVRYFFLFVRLLFVPFRRSAAFGGACLILNVCYYVF
jgi:hypothetical protein